MNNKPGVLIEEIHKSDHVAIYMTDVQGKIFVWNQKASETFGYSAQEVIGQNEAFFYVDHLEEISHEGTRYCWRARKYTESFFAKETVVEISDADNPRVRFMKMVEDVSEQLTPFERCELWMTKYANSRWGAVVTNALTNQFELVNAQFSNMYGYTIEELKGQHNSLLMPHRNKHLAADFSKLLDSRVRSQHTMTHMKKDGTVFSVLCNSTAILCEQNETVLYRISLVRPLDAAIAKDYEHMN